MVDALSLPMAEIAALKNRHASVGIVSVFAVPSADR